MKADYFNEDCFDRLSKIPDKSVNLVCCDPPYAVGFEGKFTPKDKWDTFTEDEFYQFNFKWMSEVKRILTDNGSMWMFCAHTKLPELFKVLKDVGLQVNLDKWKSIQRQKGRGAKNRPKSVKEDILHISKSNDYVWKNQSDLFKYKETVTNVLDSRTGKVERPQFNINQTVFFFKMPYYLSTTEKMIHSCQKSILLQYALIMNSSNEGDTVLDCFMGSGSSGIATELARRNYIGIERDKDMFQSAMNWKNTFDFDTYRFTYLKDIRESPK